MSGYLNSPNDFCIICGLYVININRRKFTDHYKAIYESCFEISTENLSNAWTPTTICTYCAVKLSKWKREIKKLWIYLIQ